jgi:hypothetical protein
MATYTEATGFNKGTAAAHVASGVNKVGLLEVTLNFATIAADRITAGNTAIGAGDVLEALSIPAKTYVIAVGIDVTTAEGGTLTLDIGDGADPDGYLDGVNGNAVAGYTSSLVLTEAAPNTVLGLSNGKYYAAADTIDVKTVNAADVVVMRLWAIVADCS